MRRRSSLALPNFGTRRTSNASNASAVKDEIVKDIFQYVHEPGKGRRPGGSQGLHARVSS